MLAMVPIEEQNAIHNLHFLLSEAKTTVETSMSKWNANGELTYSSMAPSNSIEETNLKLAENRSVSTMITWIEDLFENLHETSGEEFWNGDQRLICLSLCKPVLFEIMKLKRKMERLTEMIEKTMNKLYPVLKELPDYHDLDLAPTDADESITDTLDELQVSGISRSNILSRTLIRLCTCGRNSRKKERLPRIERTGEPVPDISKKCLELSTQLSDESEQFISKSTEGIDQKELNSIKSNRITQNLKKAEKKLNDSTANSQDKEKLQDKIIIESDNTNENMSANKNENIHFPFNPFQSFKILVDEMQSLSQSTIINIRKMEQNFYDPPQHCKCLDGHEFSNFAQIVLEIGERVVRSVRKYQCYEDKDGLIKNLKRIEKAGSMCQKEFKKFTKLLQNDSKMFNQTLFIYRVPYQEYKESSKSSLKAAASEIENCLDDFDYLVESANKVI